MTTLAPGAGRDRHHGRAGCTCSVEPTASSRSHSPDGAQGPLDDLGNERLAERDRVALQDAAAFDARRVVFAGANAGPVPPPSAHAGRNSSTRRGASCRALRRRLRRAARRAGAARRCSASPAPCSLPRRSSATRARWPALGSADQAGVERSRACHAERTHGRVGQVVLPASTAFPPPGSSSIRPCGPRKSGMPGLGRDAGPGQHDDAVRGVDPAADAGDGIVVDGHAARSADEPSTACPASTGAAAAESIRRVA